MPTEEWKSAKSKLSNLIFNNIAKNAKSSEKLKQLALSVIEMEIHKALGMKKLFTIK